MSLLPADIDPDHDLVKYHFISKLQSEVRMQQIRRLYEQQKNFDKIAEECHEVYDWLLSCGNKRSRTQVNVIEDNSEEEEQENGEWTKNQCQLLPTWPLPHSPAV